jgi:energy-coupling factor transporter ATP-binding protein EcfA2
MNLELRKSSRKQAKIRVALTGPSGSGKTFSSLLLARGLASDWQKIVVLDTEHGSADLYADLGPYQVITLTNPFSPEHYIQAMDLAQKEGMEVIVIDSLSHCWEYLLDVHGNMVGNSFTNWAKITPRHNALVQAILQSPSHVIATLRTKQDYVLNQKNGKYIPEKVGLKTVQRDGVDYEFTLVFDIDIKHQAIASKDRTGLFADKPQFTIDEKTGKTIKVWCESGVEEDFEVLRERIRETKSVKELLEIYESHPSSRKELRDAFAAQKRVLANGSTTNGNGPTERRFNHGK